MKKIFKIVLWSLLSVIVIAGIAMSVFVYKVRNGFPVAYETEVPTINFPANQTSILLFSKTTGFRHSESIEAGKQAFADLAKKITGFCTAQKKAVYLMQINCQNLMW